MIDSLLDRLSENTLSFKAIEHAHDMEAFVEDQQNTPALFVFVGAEDASSDGMEYLTSLRHTTTFVVHIVCPIDELNEMKREVRTALIGWNPDPDAGYDDSKFARGRMLNIKGRIAWWQDEYTTWTTLREHYQ